MELLHVSGKTSRARCLWGSINSERIRRWWNCFHGLTSPRETLALFFPLTYFSSRATVLPPRQRLARLYGGLIDGFLSNAPRAHLHTGFCLLPSFLPSFRLSMNEKYHPVPLVFLRTCYHRGLLPFLIKHGELAFNRAVETTGFTCYYAASFEFSSLSRQLFFDARAVRSFRGEVVCHFNLADMLLYYHLLL